MHNILRRVVHRPRPGSKNTENCLIERGQMIYKGADEMTMGFDGQPNNLRY